MPFKKQPLKISAGKMNCVVKCLPEFTKAQDALVSWRQAVVAAYYIFRNYENSSRLYQAVIIIRSKIR